MYDPEKVISGLQHCIDCECKEGCPYYGRCGEAGAPPVLYDALDLLKEQEEGIEPIESTHEQKKFADKIGIAVSDFWCGACKFNLMGHPKFCPSCGRKVKWNDR